MLIPDAVEQIPSRADCLPLAVPAPGRVELDHPDVIVLQDLAPEVGSRKVDDIRARVEVLARGRLQLAREKQDKERERKHSMCRRSHLFRNFVTQGLVSRSCLIQQLVAVCTRAGPK